MTRKLSEQPAQKSQKSQKSQKFDVLVIGGGAAGLSGAVVLARSRRSVLVIDAGHPRNAPATGVHGFLTRDGISPAELIATGRKEVERYGGTVIQGEVVAVGKSADGFEATLDDGTAVGARRLLVATGLADELPDLPGVRERWGRDVLHCPYCHGWEVRDQAVGVLGTGALSVRQALMFRQLTDDVVFFAHTAPELTGEQAEQLAALGIAVVSGLVDSLEVADDRLTGVRLADGTVVARQALVVAPRFVAASRILAVLGLHPTEHPMGQFIASEPSGLTSVPGVWVAGNVTDLAAQVVTAAAGGAAAGAAVNFDLVAEDTRLAVEARGNARDAANDDAHNHPLDHFTKEFWNERYGSKDKVWSGNPNPHLVAVAQGLSPATALDVGSGEGADAIWLAAQGWEVTGIDVSTVALERSAQGAAEVGGEVAARITWEQADVLTWDPAPRRFDLISVQFMHLPREPVEALHRRLAAAVRPGGSLLIVGHHPSDLDTSMSRMKGHPGFMFTAEEIATNLDPAEWDIVVAAAPERQAVDPDGKTITVSDAVLHAVRRR